MKTDSHERLSVGASARRAFAFFRPSIARKSFVLVLAALGACQVEPQGGVTFGYDPQTKQITGGISRAWEAGPVLVHGRYTAPDGTSLDFTWFSDVDVSHAAATREEQIKQLAKAVHDLEQVAAGLASPLP